MAYDVRDVTQAMFNRVNAQALAVTQDDKRVRVRTMVGQPDEAIAQQRFPVINIEPGFQINLKKEWQSKSTTEEIEGNFVKLSTTRFVDVFYTFKIGAYALYAEHIQYLEEAIFTIFPLDFCLTVKAESDGLNYAVQTTWDGKLINVDDYRRLMANPTVRESDIESDMRVLRREGLVTAHLSLEKTSEESFMRPYSGVNVTVSIVTLGS